MKNLDFFDFFHGKSRPASLPIIFFIISTVALYAQETRASAQSFYTQGRDLEAAGRTEEAETNYREAVRICNEEIASGQTNVDTYAVLTWTLQRQRKYADVITYGERALRFGNDYRIVEIMGEAYFYLQNYEMSRRMMERYVNALPEGGRASVAYFFIGEIFRLQGKPHSADIAYTTAIHVEGGSIALWWYRLGEVREAGKEYRAAIEAYEAALKITPGYTQAREGLARSRNNI